MICRLGRAAVARNGTECKLAARVAKTPTCAKCFRSGAAAPFSRAHGRFMIDQFVSAESSQRRFIHANL